MRLPVVLKTGPVGLIDDTLLKLEPLLDEAKRDNRHIVISVKDPETNRTETFYAFVAEVSEVEET